MLDSGVASDCSRHIQAPTLCLVRGVSESSRVGIRLDAKMHSASPSCLSLTYAVEAYTEIHKNPTIPQATSRLRA